MAIPFRFLHANSTLKYDGEGHLAFPVVVKGSRLATA